VFLTNRTVCKKKKRKRKLIIFLDYLDWLFSVVSLQ